MPPLTVEEALAIAIPIAAALDCAHRQGVVHRDLKPGNVMLSNNTVKLLDFGLARLSPASAGSDRNDAAGHGMVSLADLSMPTVSSPLTLKGTILGTLQYMAPEQLEGKEVDARADIFAFGGLLYEMLTGRRPFEGKSQASLIGAILDHEPPPVTTYHRSRRKSSTRLSRGAWPRILTIDGRARAIWERSSSGSRCKWRQGTARPHGPPTRARRHHRLPPARGGLAWRSSSPR